MQNIIKWFGVYAVESQKEKRKKMELGNIYKDNVQNFSNM